MNREALKIGAVYILAILLVLRLVVVPLYGSVKTKKGLLSDYSNTYNTKLQALERHRAEMASTVQGDGERLIDALYPKDEPFSTIQSDTLSHLITEAEGKGLTVVSYEMSEVSGSKVLSEVPVLIRLMGDPKKVNELMMELGSWQKKVKFKQFDVSNTPQGILYTLVITVFRVEK
jgi:hypothetical protein